MLHRMIKEAVKNVLNEGKRINNKPYSRAYGPGMRIPDSKLIGDNMRDFYLNHLHRTPEEFEEYQRSNNTAIKKHNERASKYDEEPKSAFQQRKEFVQFMNDYNLTDEDIQEMDKYELSELISDWRNSQFWRTWGMKRPTDFY